MVTGVMHMTHLSHSKHEINEKEIDAKPKFRTCCSLFSDSTFINAYNFFRIVSRFRKEMRLSVSQLRGMMQTIPVGYSYTRGIRLHLEFPAAKVGS